jgi:hypothetical protein
LDWILTPWSTCSVTCGPGTKTRQVSCPEADMCNEDTRPNDSMNCSAERPCIDWVPGPWSSCAATCGGGHQFRAIQCMDRRSSVPADEGECDQLDKPRQRQRCANEQPCLRSGDHKYHSSQLQQPQHNRGGQNEVKGYY